MYVYMYMQCTCTRVHNCDPPTADTCSPGCGLLKFELKYSVVAIRTMIVVWTISASP